MSWEPRRIVQGSLYANNQQQKHVEVLSEYEDVFDRFDVRPPKIILALSITKPQERRRFPGHVWAFPAALDTGLNRVLEIDVRHLEKWANCPRNKLTPYRTGEKSELGTYDVCLANVWLHRRPYHNPLAGHYGEPFLMENSTKIRVMHPTSPHMKPRMPLVGLQALLHDGLHLKVDGRRGMFSIHRAPKRPYFFF